MISEISNTNTKIPISIFIGTFQPVAYHQLDIIRKTLYSNSGVVLIVLCNKPIIDRQYVLTHTEITSLIRKYFSVLDNENKTSFNQRVFFLNIPFTSNLEEWTKQVKNEIKKYYLDNNPNYVPSIMGTSDNEVYYKYYFSEYNFSEIHMSNIFNSRNIRDIIHKTTTGDELKTEFEKKYRWYIPPVIIDNLISYLKPY